MSISSSLNSSVKSINFDIASKEDSFTPSTAANHCASSLSGVSASITVADSSSSGLYDHHLQPQDSSSSSTSETQEPETIVKKSPKNSLITDLGHALFYQHLIGLPQHSKKKKHTVRQEHQPEDVRKFFANSELLDRMCLKPLDHIAPHWEIFWDSDNNCCVPEEKSFAKDLNHVISLIADTPNPARYHDNEDVLAEAFQSRDWPVQKKGSKWIGEDYSLIIQQGAFDDENQQHLITAASGRVHAALKFGQKTFDEMEAHHMMMLSDLISTTIYHRLGDRSAFLCQDMRESEEGSASLFSPRDLRPLLINPGESKSTSLSDILKIRKKNKAEGIEEQVPLNPPDGFSIKIIGSQKIIGFENDKPKYILRYPVVSVTRTLQTLEALIKRDSDDCLELSQPSNSSKDCPPSA